MKKILSLILGLVMVFAVSQTVWAKENVRSLDARKSNLEKTREQDVKREVKREENQDRRCEMVEQKLTNQIMRYEKVRHHTEYLRIQTWLSTVIERLDNAGTDTTLLEEMSAVLDQKVQKLADDKSAYITQLKLAQQYVCGESEGSFKEALIASRGLLKTVHDDVMDIKNYWQDSIKPALRAALDKPGRTETE